MSTDLKVLLSIGDRIIAEDIQRLLEENGIYSLLISDNAAAAAMQIFAGSISSENITIKVHIDSYENAVKLITSSQYADILE
jgi:hypothetical protein